MKTWPGLELASSCRALSMRHVRGTKQAFCKRGDVIRITSKAYRYLSGGIHVLISVPHHCPLASQVATSSTVYNVEAALQSGVQKPSARPGHEPLGCGVCAFVRLSLQQPRVNRGTRRHLCLGASNAADEAQKSAVRAVLRVELHLKDGEICMADEHSRLSALLNLACMMSEGSPWKKV